MIAALLLAAAPAGWQNARAIVTHVTAPVYVRLALPQTVGGGPGARYPDVRIADAQNREVPYALDAQPAAVPAAPATLSDVGFVAGRFTQAIADLGTSGALHSAIELDASQPTFFERVEIATSDDRSTWAVVRNDALIYRVAQNGDDGENTVAFGPSRARWLRIRILDPTRAFPLTGASVPASAIPPRLVPLEAVTSAKTAGSQSVVTLDFGTPDTNVGALAFQTGTAQFSRAVSIRIDGDEAPGVTIARYAAGRPQLTAWLGDRFARRLRVTVENGDDPPLANLRVTALGYQHDLVFAADPGGEYRLLWGNAAAPAPVYDLSDRLQHQPWSVGAVATLGGAASTALLAAVSTPPTPPWLQQAALPIALAVACIALIGIALVAMRSKPVP